jgi:ubiquinone/menaquinone biosynthesis C-methylase UbiE
MNTADSSDFIVLERDRMRREYERRARDIAADRYASWQPSMQFMLEKRSNLAAAMLKQLNRMPGARDKCLEVGFGTGAWLHQLAEWGVSESNLHGIELDEARVTETRPFFPSADLRVGDAVDLPWREGEFQLVVASTLFTSVLDLSVRRLIANQIYRVLAPGGVLLWYDFAINNPRNVNVRKITRKEVTALFPDLRGQIKSVTLAPPLTRVVAPRSRAIANFLEAIPFLRTHLLAVLMKS